MSSMKLDVNAEEFRYLLFGGRKDFEIYQNLRDVFASNDILRPKPIAYSYEYNKQMETQAETLLELSRLNKEKKVRLANSTQYLSDFSMYTTPLELHFGVFKHIAQYFAQDSKLMQELIDNLQLFGGVLMSEIEFSTHAVNDNIRTYAHYDPRNEELILNTPKGFAKFCGYYNSYATHAVVICRLYNDTEFLGPYPVMVSLRDPATGELRKGIEVNWLGPSFGYRGGRENYVTFENVRVSLKQHMLNKFLRFDKSALLITTVNVRTELLISTAIMRQKMHDSTRAVRELSKAAYLVVKYTNMRTQFKTLTEKGQERKVFEYQFNKMRIIKHLTNAVVFQIGLRALQDRINILVADPEKNFDRLGDYVTFVNALYPFMYEKTAEGVESLREGTGGLGFLKFSGIPTAHENIVNGLAAAGPGKEERYIDLAIMLLNADLENKSDFLKFAVRRLSEEDQTPLPTFKEERDYLNLQNYIALHALKVIRRRAALLKVKTGIQTVILPEHFEGKRLLQQEAIQLGKDLIEYTLGSASYMLLFKYINRESNSVLAVLLHNFFIQNFIDDIKPLLEDSKNVPEDFYTQLKDLLASNVDNLGSVAEKLTHSFEFDTGMLNSCFLNTAQETYENLFDLCKNHNLRNDPKMHAEVRKDLISYLNRPQAKL